MIRINLLPSAKKTGRARKGVSSGPTGGGIIWGLGYLFAALVLLAVCGGIYLFKRGELAERVGVNDALLASIVLVEARSAGIEELEAKIAERRQLEELVAELNRARLGPTRVLMEISRVLTPGGGPTIDAAELERIERESPLSVYNRNWDGRRVWIRGFGEENRECQISGFGKSHDDVAEFLRRLQISEIFEQVTLTRTQSIEDADGLSLIEFELTCRVVY